MLSGTCRNYKHLYFPSFLILIVIVFNACTVVKDYPINKPFAFKTDIELKGSFSTDEKAELSSRLYNQLDDSLKDKVVIKFMYFEIKKPPVYDSSNALNSIVYMKKQMKNMGYFHNQVTYRATFDTVHRKPLFGGQKKPAQIRSYVHFDVAPGKATRVDSIAYNFAADSTLQALSNLSVEHQLIKKSDPFNTERIGFEIERLRQLYKENGYYKLGSDMFNCYWDTIETALLKPALDPIEQLEILKKVQERRENPKVNIEYTIKANDLPRLKKYYIGNTTVYPDYQDDTTGLTARIKEYPHLKVVQYNNTFKPKIFIANNYFKNGHIYKESVYNKSIQRYNNLESWQTGNIERVIRANTDTIDIMVKLYPAKKFSFNTGLEASRNTSTISGRILGLGYNASITNRNFFKSANLSTSNFRYGIELGNASSTLGKFIQTQQFSFSQNFYFPRFIPRTKLSVNNINATYKSVLSFNIAYTERFKLFNLITLSSAWGYEYQHKNNTYSLKLPNIEYSKLNPTDSFSRLLARNPSLKYVFTDGFITSCIGGFATSHIGSKTKSKFNANFEYSPLLIGLLRSRFLDSNLYRFVKADVEFAKLYQLSKSTFAFRLFAGVGFEFNSTKDPTKRNNLPFFKQYFSGGPNSMRAWKLRSLGPGSLIKDENSFPDRFGDLQLEANAEYRFLLAKPIGIPINGALFLDVGNVWLLKDAPDRKLEERFNLSRLGKDIAIGLGGGIRIDISGFIVVRIDYAYKVKDPSPAKGSENLQNKLFGYNFFRGSNLQFGIGYPFIF